jgi:hypothetical protein
MPRQRTSRQRPPDGPRRTSTSLRQVAPPDRSRAIGPAGRRRASSAALAWISAILILTAITYAPVRDYPFVTIGRIRDVAARSPLSRLTESPIIRRRWRRSEEPPRPGTATAHGVGQWKDNLDCPSVARRALTPGSIAPRADLRDGPWGNLGQRAVRWSALARSNAWSRRKPTMSLTA